MPIGFTGKAWRKVTKEEEKEWQKLYDGGMTYRAIGRKYGRDHAVISKHVRGNKKQTALNRRNAILNQNRSCTRKQTKTGVKPMSHKKKTVYQMVNNAKSSAKRKNIPFSLTSPLIWEMAEKQDFKCAITGISFDWSPPPKGRRTNPYRLSIDRIIPSRGYVLENIRLVIWAVNLAIGEWGIDVYKKVSNAYAETAGLLW